VFPIQFPLVHTLTHSYTAQCATHTQPLQFPFKILGQIGLIAKIPILSNLNTVPFKLFIHYIKFKVNSTSNHPSTITIGFSSNQHHPRTPKSSKLSQFDSRRLACVHHRQAVHPEARI